MRLLNESLEAYLETAYIGTGEPDSISGSGGREALARSPHLPVGIRKV